MGTARSSAIGFVAWEAEDSFADAADDTYTERLQVRDDSIDLSGLARPLVNRGGVHQRLNESDLDVPGAFGVGTFSFSMDLYGHGASTGGALTATPLSRLLAHVLGNTSAAQVGGLLTTGTNDADTLTSTNTTLLQGGIIRVGALGDGRAEGQAAVLADATTSYELLTALPGSPTTADTVRAMLMVHPVSGGSAALTSSAATSNNTLRFVLATSNLQYVARGCACTAVSITGLTPGELPKVSFTFSAVAWGPVSQTFPSATATADFSPAPTAAGSLFVQARGTVTRATQVPRDLTLTIGQGMQPIVGQGGATNAQNIVGWTRIPAMTTLSFAVEAEAATATPTWWDYFSTSPDSIVSKHVLYTANPIDGRAIALYLPNAKPMTSVPTQEVIDGLHYVRINLEAATGLDTTNELTLSAWRLGLG